eukprot:scaffold360_cov374-Pavlova_lutheri.AAC.14
MPLVPWSAWAAPCPKRPKEGEFWEPPRPATPSPCGRRTIQDQEGSDSASPRRTTQVSDEKERGTGLRQRKSPRTHAPPQVTVGWNEERRKGKERKTGIVRKKGMERKKERGRKKERPG